MLDIGVIGATGYAGEELVRLLSAHPEARLSHICSQSFAGKPMESVYGNYRAGDLPPLETAELSQLANCDFVFLALPHGASAKAAKELLESGSTKVIDLSGDFRYDDISVYEDWYGLTHPCPKLNGDAVYGLPELYRHRIAETRLLANPGCYTTTSILPLYPLLKAGLIESEGIIIDAKSGITGAGRKDKLEYSYCECDGNLKVYGVPRHRHTSEIEQELSHAAGAPVTLTFAPHLLPVKRGILATIYARLKPGVTKAQLDACYAEAYAKEPFTAALPAGRLPELKLVVGSNRCLIGFEVNERTGTLLLVSCTDNLIKGAAGQAIQNMNIMAGLPEETGLPTAAWYL